MFHWRAPSLLEGQSDMVACSRPCIVALLLRLALSRYWQRTGWAMFQPGLDGEETTATELEDLALLNGYVAEHPEVWLQSCLRNRLQSLERLKLDMNLQVFLLYNTWQELKLKRLVYILNVQGVYSVLLQRMLLLFQGNFPLVIWSLSDVTIQEEVHLGHLPRECLAMKGRRTCGCCVAMFLCWLLHRMWGLQVHLKLWPSQFSMEIQFCIVNDGGQQSFLDARRVAAASEDGIVPSPSVLHDALPIRNENLSPVPEEGRWLCLEHLTRYLWWWWQRWWWWWRWRTSSRCSSEQKRDSHSCCFWQKRQTKNGSATPGVRERDIVDVFTQSAFSVRRIKCISIGKCTCVERECAAFLAQHSSKSLLSTSTTSWSLCSCTSSTGRRSRRSKRSVYNFSLSTGKRSRWSTRQEGVESHSLWFCPAWCARRLARFACQGVEQICSVRSSPGYRRQCPGGGTRRGAQQVGTHGQSWTQGRVAWLCSSWEEQSCVMRKLWNHRGVAQRFAYGGHWPSFVDSLMGIMSWSSFAFRWCHESLLSDSAVEFCSAQGRAGRRWPRSNSRSHLRLDRFRPRFLVTVGWWRSWYWFLSVTFTQRCIFFLVQTGIALQSWLHMWMICFIHTYPKGRIQWRILLSKFDLGSTEMDNFRSLVLREAVWPRSRWDDHNRSVRQHPMGERHNNRRNTSKHRPTFTRWNDGPQVHTGSLPWVARQGRPDLGYRVSRLQSSMKGATVGTLVDANRCVELAHRGFTKVRLRYPMNHLRWDEIATLKVTDASFSNEIITVHSRVESTLSSTTTRRRTHGTPSIGFCQRLLFVGCADLRCRRKPTHYNMVSKLVTNSEEWSLSWRDKYGADSSEGWFEDVHWCAFHTSILQSVEVLQTTWRPKVWLACRTTGLASNWWPSTTRYGVTVRKLGILWRMVGTVLNGFLRLRWYQTASRLWNRTSYWKSGKNTFTDEYRNKNPKARLGP